MLKSASQMHVALIDQTPPSNSPGAFDHRACFIGVSIDNPAFEKERLDALIIWAAAHFERCLVVVGDVLSRHNHLLHGLTAEAMRERCLTKGIRIAQRLDAFIQHQHLSNVSLLRWADLDFASEFADVGYAVVHNRHLKTALYREADAFTTRQIRAGRLQSGTYPEALAGSLRYLIEEIAAFEHLVRSGHDVSVYPGQQLEVLKQMSTREISVSNLHIAKCTYVDVAIRRDNPSEI